jgi:hypothetical protein
MSYLGAIILALLLGWVIIACFSSTERRDYR